MKKYINVLLALFAFATIVHADPTPEEWREYIDGTIGKPVYYLLDNSLIRSGCSAVDFGSGAGNEAIMLLKNHCDVLGVDLSPHSGEVIQARAGLIQSMSSFKFQGVDFAKAQLLGGYDLFISYFAFPFGNKKDLPLILNNIKEHARPGAILSINMFGAEHTFVKQGVAYAVTEREIKELISARGFNINYFLHRIYKQRDFEGNNVVWDVYDINAVKW